MFRAAVTLLLSYFAALFGGAWALMLWVGSMHINWWPAVPLMSYDAALSISLVSVTVLFVSQLLAQLIKAVNS